jgi:hypothetical protein
MNGCLLIHSWTLSDFCVAGREDYRREQVEGRTERGGKSTESGNRPNPLELREYLAPSCMQISSMRLYKTLGQTILKVELTC